MNATLKAMGIEAGQSLAQQTRQLEQHGVNAEQVAKAVGVSTTTALSPADTAKQFSYNSPGVELKAITRPGDNARDLGVGQSAPVAADTSPPREELTRVRELWEMYNNDRILPLGEALKRAGWGLLNPVTSFFIIGNLAPYSDASMQVGPMVRAFDAIARDCPKVASKAREMVDKYQDLTLRMHDNKWQTRNPSSSLSREIDAALREMRHQYTDMESLLTR